MAVGMLDTLYGGPPTTPDPAAPAPAAVLAAAAGGGGGGRWDSPVLVIVALVGLAIALTQVVFRGQIEV